MSRLFSKLVSVDAKRLRLYLGLMLAAATLTVFWPLGGHDFIIYDDPEYVTENPYVRMGLARASIGWAFTSFHSANWHPLTWLSHMADVQLFGLDPSGHHITSLILHTTNVVLLFLLLSGLTGFPWRSAVVAALFAFHPLHVESVAWIAERKDVLCALFYLLTLHAWAGYLKSPATGRYLLVCLCFVAGLMAKPMLVTLPFVLLLLDYWPLARMGTRGMYCAGVALTANAPGSVNSPGRLILEKVPLLLLAGISCAVTVLAQHKVGAVKSLSSYPFPLRLANAVTAYADYLRQTVWPRNLAVFYPFPKTIPWSQLLVAAGFLAAISLAALSTRREKPYVLFGWLWYLGVLVPVVGLVQVGGQARADRYTYIALIGIFVAAVWWLCELRPGFRRRKIVLTAIAASTVAVCIGATLKQASYWRNDVTLFSHALEATDDNYVAHTNLGFVLVRQGLFAEASRHFLEAIRISPNFADAYLNQGDNLLRAGEFEKSIAFIAKAIEIRPGFAAAYNDLGVAMLRTGRLREAYENFTAATELDPLMRMASTTRGLSLACRGNRTRRSPATRKLCS